MEQKKPSVITVFVIAFIWVGFLIGIIGYKPYMKNHGPKEVKEVKQIEQQLEQQNEQQLKGE